MSGYKEQIQGFQHEIKKLLKSYNSVKKKDLLSKQRFPHANDLKILNQLAKIFNKYKNDPNLLSVLEDYLNNHWKEILEGKVISYTALPDSPVTHLLCDIAALIRDDKNKNYTIDNEQEPLSIINVLMPSVYTESIMDGYPDFKASYDENTHTIHDIDIKHILKTHILGRDGLYLIPVHLLTKQAIGAEALKGADDADYPTYIQPDEVIEEIQEEIQILIDPDFVPPDVEDKGFAKTEITSEISEVENVENTVKINNPYYNFENKNHSGFLYESEYTRLVNHSDPTKAWYEAKLKYEAALRDDSNLYGQLMRLADQMFMSSKDGVGGNYKAGDMAYVALGKFFEYYDELVRYLKPDLPGGLKRELAILRSYIYPEDNVDRTDDGSTCMQVRRSWLLDSMTGCEETLQSISLTGEHKVLLLTELENDLNNKRENLRNAPANGTDTITANYKLAANLAVAPTHLIASPTFFEETNSIDIAEILQDKSVQKKFFSLYPKAEDFITLKNKLPADKFKSLFLAIEKDLKRYNFTEANLFILLTNSDESTLKMLVKSIVFKQVIKKPANLVSLVSKFKDPERGQILTYYNDYQPQFINSKHDLLLLLKISLQYYDDLSLFFQVSNVYKKQLAQFITNHIDLEHIKSMRYELRLNDENNYSTFIKILETGQLAHFDDLLKLIEEKAEKFTKNSTEAIAAGNLRSELIQAKNTYLTDKNYAVFKDSCNTAFDKARPTLESHREWYNFFAVLTLSVVTLGIAPAIMVAVNLTKRDPANNWYKLRLFDTNSSLLAKKVEESVAEIQITNSYN